MSALAGVIQLDLEALKASAPFRALTSNQQVWLVQFLTNGGDRAAAAKVAYPDAKAHSQVIMSYQVPKSPAMIEALDWWRFRNAKSSRQALIELVRQQLKAAEPGSVSAQRLCSQLQSLTLGAKDDEPEGGQIDEALKTDTSTQRFYVGQRVNQRDGDGVLHTGVVKALGADGRPSQIEEIAS